MVVLNGHGRLVWLARMDGVSALLIELEAHLRETSYSHPKTSPIGGTWFATGQGRNWDQSRLLRLYLDQGLELLKDLLLMVW